MSLSRTLVASLALSIAAIGCGGGMTPPADSGVPSDSGTMMMMGDGGMMMMTTDGGGGGMSGTCGDTTKACICACSNNQMCINNCIRMNSTCNMCVLQAQLGCCPTETMALQTCANNAMMASDAGPACTDNNCIAMRCMAETQAILACANNPATQMMPACQSMLAGCLGNYPIACP